MRYLITLLLITSAFLFSGCKKEQGCTNIQACNFSQSAEEDDGSCYLPGEECDDGNDSTILDQYTNTCQCEGLPPSWVCTDYTACNYSVSVDTANGLCVYPGDPCDDGNSATENDTWSNNCSCEGHLCGSSISHEGYEYSTVQIGDQCWFSENCRYLPEVSPPNEESNTDPYYYVYDYQGADVVEAKATENYETYGVLYNWPAVLTEGICPSGWHIPSGVELYFLLDFLGGVSVAGNAMKSTSGWTNNGNGTNSSGFNGLPGGKVFTDSFDDLSFQASWWTYSSYSSSLSENFYLNYNLDYAFTGTNYKENGFSARCVRD